MRAGQSSLPLTTSAARGLLTVLLGAVLAVGPPAAAQIAEPPPEVAPEGEASPELQAPEPVPVGTFEPAGSLTLALERALAAVRAAEKGGPDARAKFLEARFYNQEALKYDQVNLKAGFISARLNILMGQTRLAFSEVRDYTKKSAEGSVDWEAYRILGDLHFAGTYYVQAEAHYREAARLAPSEPSIFVGLSKCALKQAKRPMAVQFAQKAVQLDPRSAENLEVFSEALVENSMLPDAKTAIVRARDLTRAELQEDPSSLQLLARLQTEHQSLQKIIRAQLRKDSSDGRLYLEMTESMLEAADLNRLTVLHQLQGNLQVGLEATQPKTPPELIAKYAEVSAALHKHREAIETLEKYLEKNPLDEAARQSLDMLKAGLEVEPAVASAPPTTP